MSNTFVGAMMCVGGAFMIFLAFASDESNQGNVLFGLAIAVMGVVANTIFWRRYVLLNRKEPNAILAVQGRLYRAKSLVDLCVTTALLSIAVAPGTAFSAWLDFCGSIVVAVYLGWCGVRTVWESLKK